MLLACFSLIALAGAQEADLSSKIFDSGLIDVRFGDDSSCNVRDIGNIKSFGCYLFLEIQDLTFPFLMEANISAGDNGDGDMDFRLGFEIPEIEFGNIGGVDLRTPKYSWTKSFSRGGDGLKKWICVSQIDKIMDAARNSVSALSRHAGIFNKNVLEPGGRIKGIKRAKRFLQTPLGLSGSDMCMQIVNLNWDNSGVSFSLWAQTIALDADRTHDARGRVLPLVFKDLYNTLRDGLTGGSGPLKKSVNLGILVHDLITANDNSNGAVSWLACDGVVRIGSTSGAPSSCPPNYDPSLVNLSSEYEMHPDPPPFPVAEFQLGISTLLVVVTVLFTMAATGVMCGQCASCGSHGCKSSYKSVSTDEDGNIVYSATDYEYTPDGSCQLIEPQSGDGSSLGLFDKSASLFGCVPRDLPDGVPNFIASWLKYVPTRFDRDLPTFAMYGIFISFYVAFGLWGFHNYMETQRTIGSTVSPWDGAISEDDAWYFEMWMSVFEVCIVVAAVAACETIAWLIVLRTCTTVVVSITIIVSLVMWLVLCVSQLLYGNFVLGCILGFLFCTKVLWLIWNRNRIKLSILLISESVKSSSRNPYSLMLALSLGTALQVLNVLCGAGFVFSKVPATVKSDLLIKSPNESLPFGLLALVLMTWMTHVNVNFIHAVNIRVIADWARTPGSSAGHVSKNFKLSNPSWLAVGAGATYQAAFSDLPAITVGGLLSALCAGFVSLVKKIKKWKKNPIVNFIVSTALSLIGPIINAFSRLVYVEVALRGMPFFNAARRTTGLMVKKAGFTVAIVEDILDDIMGFASSWGRSSCAAIGGFVGTILAYNSVGGGFGMFSSWDSFFQFTLTPPVCTFLGGVIGEAMVQNGFMWCESGVIALLVLWCEEESMILENHPDTAGRLSKIWRAIHDKTVLQKIFTRKKSVKEPEDSTTTIITTGEHDAVPYAPVVITEPSDITGIGKV